MLPDDAYPDFNADDWRKHLDALSSAIPRTSTGPEIDVNQPAPAMPLHAPEWLWEAMETHLEQMEALEIVWTGIERTFIAISDLPETTDCPEGELCDGDD